MARRASIGPSEDHPRIRGEHLADALDQGADDGSSPHTRGAPSIGSVTEDACRIIPAYAGSTVRSVGARGWYGDHPRIRGEHDAHGAAHECGPGSSPHTRGALAAAAAGAGAAGIIPAYAGSTLTITAAVYGYADHPRIRGEHGARWTPSRDHPGSSPHTRGARPVLWGVSGFAGIIPAYAGSTGPGGRRAVTIRDHPRIRGEHGPSCGA